MKRSHPATLAEGVRQMHVEAAGLLGVNIVRQADVPRLLLDSLTGDEAATMLLQQVSDCIQRIQEAPADRRTQCGCCGSDLHSSKFSIVIASPEIPDPSAGLAMAICFRCGTTVGAIRAAAIRALKLLWPDLRPVTITHTGGNA